MCISPSTNMEIMHVTLLELVGDTKARITFKTCIFLEI